MLDRNPPPLTPDFETWPLAETPIHVFAEDGALAIQWSDGRVSRYAAALLAENDPSPETLHPVTRETLLSPLALPADLAVAAAELDTDGAVRVLWSGDRPPSRFHAGWLLGVGWFDAPGRAQVAVGAAPVTAWTGAELAEPPTFDGPAALREPRVWLAWLTALRRYGVARLEGLTPADGVLLDVVGRIGPVRESNFGRMYTLEIKDDPDSNAFTAGALLQHIDMPTRETPHGLQFLFCRENSTRGGEGVYADGYRIAEDLRAEAPQHFAALCEIVWTYNNRAKGSSYVAAGPVIERGADGAITGVRYNTWLRAPLKAPLATQRRAYAAYRAFAERAEDPRYQLRFRYRAGDLLAFDNRRALHGRAAYDAAGGSRFIEGVYADRDDLSSAIRTLERAAQKETDA